MRAVRFHRFGGPGVLQLDTVAEPDDPTGDEVLVEVTASSINGTDLGIRRGDLKVATLGRMPFTVGFDISGTVIRCGPAVTAFTTGDAVMALLGHGGGGLAERVLLRQSRAARVPRSVPLSDAAALPLAGLTALQALHGRAGLHTRAPGTTVLVVGAAGGIGAYAVQLATLAGAHVTAVASPATHDLVTSLGVKECLPRGADLARVGRWDVVLDTPGAVSLTTARDILTEGGVLVSTRPISVDALRARTGLTRHPMRNRYRSVITAARSQDLAHLARLVDDGQLRIPVQTRFAAAHSVAAHTHAESAARGKTIIALQV